MTKKGGMEDLERLRVIDVLVHDELFAMTDDEIAALAQPGDVEAAAAILDRAKKDHGKQRLADARAAMRAAPMRGTAPTAPRPPAQRPVTLAARNAKAGHSADQAGIAEDLAELEADRERDRDES